MNHFSRLFALISLVFLFTSCISNQYMENRKVYNNSIKSIDSYGFTESNIFVINFKSQLKNKKLEQFHVKIPIQQYLETYNQSTEQFVKISEGEIANKELKKMYLLDHDYSEITSNVFVLEFNESLIQKGGYPNKISTTKSRVEKIENINDYVYNVEDFSTNNPLVIPNES